MTRRLPAPLIAYRAAMTMLGPAAPFLLRRRARNGKEDTARLGERYGIAGRPRPDGNLVWAHGASIGESLSLLPIVEALARRGLKVLVTSGTRTSADIMMRRLPAGARHQYVPLDVPRLVERFLDHWQPHLVLFAESEIWPNTILALDRRRIPLILVNGRLSPRSFARWARVPVVARALFGRFALCIAQSDGDAERLARLGAPLAEVSGNLKFDIAPLPADPAAVESLAGLVAGRPVWIAASTHPGEDAMVLSAHRELGRRLPRLLTILAPRHPGRGGEVAALAHDLGLSVGRRSTGSRPDASHDVHVVDTVGELGLFYRVCPLAFMGGSLVPHGGQNPIEPARLGTAILHGPHVGNFQDVYAALDAGGGAVPVADPHALAAAAADLLVDSGLMRDMARAGSETVGALAGALDRTIRAIDSYLPRPRDAAEALW